MPNTPKILAFAGSARKDSFNKKLVKVAATGAKAAGAEVTFLDLGDYPLPLFDQDLEDKSGAPENAQKLKAIFKSHQGFLIASPEYNSSISPLLKNTIDWISRPSAKDEPSLAAFRGKVVALMSASPGALGGLRGLVTVRSILGNIGVTVLPDQIALPTAHEAFEADGKLKNKTLQGSVEKLGAGLAQFLTQLAK